MATVTPPSSPGRIERDHGRIRHPLDRLRKYINAYIGVEAIALVGLIVTLAFWVGLWSDFGAFKLVTLDWVQSAPWGFRLVVLAGFLILLVGFVLFVVLTRFFKEFRDSALALVLERRFPGLLGDRLITAVELASPKKAATYGYSPDLVAQTIHEAADRVEQVPVAEVFAWKRLWTYGLVLLYLSVGLYLLTAAGFCAARIGKKQPALEGVADFHEVATIWAERNLLLRNVIWPRQAHLEVLPFDMAQLRVSRDELRKVVGEKPVALSREEFLARIINRPAFKRPTPAHTERFAATLFDVLDTDRDGTLSAVEIARLPDLGQKEARIPKDQPAPPLRIRAWKYVLADRDAPEGWRMLTWIDLEQKPALAGGDVPAVPADWKPRDLENGVTVDEVELRLEAFPVRKKAPAGAEVPAGAVYLTQNTDGSWRELMWSDLNVEKLGGLNVPALPGEWDPKARAAVGVSSIGVGGTGIPVVAPILVGPKMINLSADQVKEAAAAGAVANGSALDMVSGTFRKKLAAAAQGKAREAVETASADTLESWAADLSRGTAMSKDKVVQELATVVRASPELRADLDRLSALVARKELLASVSVVLTRLDRIAELRETLDRIESRASDRAMRRTMRKLKIPDTEKTLLVFRGRRTMNTATLTRGGDNEYTGSFGDLKETVSYYVRGEDYVTPTKHLVVVELPRLEKLESEEERPAYLYYRPADPAQAGELRGKRQPFAPVAVSLSGEATTIEVPAGTNVTLTGTSSKPLRGVTIAVDKKYQKDSKVFGVSLIDETTFKVVIPDVRREQRFAFEFEDTDEVKGRRAVIVQPREDVAPRIREFNPDEVIRKAKEGFLVSANARLPFKARVRDDHGLARVRYGCKVIPADFLNEQKVVSLNGVAAVPLIGRPETTFMALGYMAVLNKILAGTAGDDVGDEQFLDVPLFTEQVRANRPGDGRAEILEAGTMLTLRGQRQTGAFRRLLNDFSLTPDKWTDNDEDGGINPRRWVRAQDQRAPLGSDLPLWKLLHKGKPLKETDESKTQRRYVIEVRLVADDTYTEGDLDPKKQPLPHSSPSSETFTLVVLPENELLSKIAEEEETKFRDIVKLIKPLNDGRDRMSDINVELSVAGTKQEIINGMIARCDALDETLKMAHQDTIAVKNVYERLVREQRLNQVNEALTEKLFLDVTLPLIRVSDTQFDRTIQAVRDVRKTLDNQDNPPAKRGEEARPKAQYARNQLGELVGELQKIINKMQSITEINVLIKELAEIEKKEADLESVLKKVRAERLRILLGGGS